LKPMGQFYSWVAQGRGKSLAFYRLFHSNMMYVRHSTVNRAYLHSLSVFVTSKTVCICERIARDRHNWDVSRELTQYFIARSKRICDIVSELVGTEYEEENQELRKIEYLTFRKFIEKCMTALPGAVPRKFDNDSRVDFQRFKRDFKAFLDNCGLDPLVVWTQIRSFIKGSVEALVKDDAAYISLDEYLDFTVFSSARCRLAEPQRRIAYEIFEKYEAEKDRLELWDDCDLITAVHARYEESTNHGTFPMNLKADKLYVDEVQDYTQAEIALFFRMCSAGNLFLAGVRHVFASDMMEGFCLYR